MTHELSSDNEQQDLKLLLSELNRYLDTVLEKVEADHIEIAENLSQMRNRRPATGRLPGETSSA